MISHRKREPAALWCRRECTPLVRIVRLTEWLEHGGRFIADSNPGVRGHRHRERTI